MPIDDKASKKEDRINILSLSWRDIRSAKSGGAEVYTFDLLNHADPARYRFVHFSPRYKGLPEREMIGRVKCIRRGNAISVIFWAFLYYIKHHDQFDFVIDQCNTHRFFTRFWVPGKKRIFFIHQLTREIWDINLRFPFNVIGRNLENAFLRLQRNDPVLTVSRSTKQDLLKVGFDEKRIYVIPNTISNDILDVNFEQGDKRNNHRFIFVGRYSQYKGIDAAIHALGIVKNTYPDATLTVVGKRDEHIIESVLKPIAERMNISIGEDASNAVILKGFVSEEEKYRLMRNSRLLLFPSVREGWGIIVSEAAALGTPSVVYDNPGCRDAVDHGNAGYLCRENTPQELARLMIRSIEEPEEYEKMRNSAWKFAQKLTEERRQQLFDRMMDDLVASETTDGCPPVQRVSQHRG